jgi:hypothetical protein
MIQFSYSNTFIHFRLLCFHVNELYLFNCIRNSYCKCVLYIYTTVVWKLTLVVALYGKYSTRTANSVNTETNLECLGYKIYILRLIPKMMCKHRRRSTFGSIFYVTVILVLSQQFGWTLEFHPTCRNVYYYFILWNKPYIMYLS